ncbi:MAG: energy-coupling factor transporter transmembrane protein EcfT [Spirochaetales bacterium]|nr:energy-coupling factor transporter transmembrane protein EcfT [Spirochaetales bacterium]
MGRIEKRNNPGILFLELLAISILISSASLGWLGIYAFIFIVASLIFRRGIFHSFRKSPFLIILIAMSFISHFAASANWEVGLGEAARLTLLLAFSFLFIEVVDSAELASSLGKLFSYFIGKKAWVLSSMMTVTVAIIPIIIESSKEMFHARQSRNEDYLRHPVKGISNYSVSLMRHLFARSEEFYNALLARGYREDMERSAPPIHFTDVLSLLGVAALCVLVMINRISGN